MYPEMQILLFFIIPVKMKWMAVVYAVLIAINLILTSWGRKNCYHYVYFKFQIFFLSTRNYRRVSPKEIHRKQVFKAQMREPRKGSMVTKHKCAVCGRTELDDQTWNSVSAPSAMVITNIVRIICLPISILSTARKGKRDRTTF